MSAPNHPYAIFPVGPDKTPLISGWQEKATRDPEIIRQWAANGAKAWGILCGERNGLFVIDIDVDKATGERVGEASLEAMGRYRKLLRLRCVDTPSGGSHLYLAHFNGAKNSTSKIGPKIDTRGEGGYVIAPGSLTDGGVYTGWVPCPKALQPVPLGLRAMLLQAPPPPRQHSDRITPTGEVQELLTHIPPDAPYQDWLNVLMALHDRFGGSDEGLALADQWSATGVKYRTGEVSAKWRSFKRSGVTWATIPALARQHGADLSEIARKWAV